MIINLLRFKNSIKVYINHVLQPKVRIWYKISNYITISGTILRHSHRCPKIKKNDATYPKLGHGREQDIGLRFVLRWS